MADQAQHDPLTDLPPIPRKDARAVRVIVDTPQGSHYKYSYDHRKRLFRLTKVLPAGATFPFNFGYIPSTRGGDGDGLDVLVLMDAPAFVGCLIDVRIIGVLEAEQTKPGKSRAVRNDRFIAVAVQSNSHSAIIDLEQISPALLDEIEHFFVSYNKLENKRFTVLGRHGAKRADKLLAKAIKKYKKLTALKSARNDSSGLERG